MRIYQPYEHPLHDYQTIETTELIFLFPHDYPDSTTYAIYLEELDAQVLDDWHHDQYIARNFGDCGRSLHDYVTPEGRPFGD